MPGAEAPPPRLALDAVAVRYGGAVQALQALSLCVQPGEVHVLLGPNGAGKSTALKAIAGLLPAEGGAISAGRVHFDGQVLDGQPPAWRVRAGLVPVLEGRRLFPRLSLEDNLRCGGLGRDASAEELAQDLEAVYTLFPRLRECRRSPAGLGSGGEQQMAAIGRALMARPRLLLLDELSMGLAARVVDEIVAVLHHLNTTQGLSLLLAEQGAGAVLRHAHRVTVIDRGRAERSGPVAALGGREALAARYFGVSEAA